VIITDAAEPTWRYGDQRVQRMIQAMPADELKSAHAIRQPVTTNEAIQASFDGELTYMKGSSVLHQIESFVGAEKWQAFIRAYVKKHAWGNTTEADFVGEMRAALGAEAADGFETYITRPGVPRVRATAKCGPASEISFDPMDRAFPAGVVEDADDRIVFTIPVCVRYGDAVHSDRACSTHSSIAVAYCPTWIISNAGGVGYYRSAIDPAIARALLNPSSNIAKVAKPTRAEKLVMIADLAAMVRRDELPVDRVLPLVPILAKDADPKIASAAALAAPLHMGGLDDELALRVRRWFVAIFAPIAKQLGWRRAPSDSNERHELRIAAISWSATFDPVLHAQAVKLADQWLVDRTGLDDDLVDTALRSASYGGDAAYFDRILEAAKHPRDHDEVQRLMSTLGGFTDAKLGARARDILYGQELDLRDTITIMYVQLQRREAREAAFDSLEQHLDEILSRMRDDEASWALGAIASTFCDAAHRARVEKLLVARATKIAGAQTAVARGLERADQCITEVAREMPALQRFFKK